MRRKTTSLALAAALAVGSLRVLPSCNPQSKGLASGYQKPEYPRSRPSKRSPADRVLLSAQERRKDGKREG